MKYNFSILLCLLLACGIPMPSHAQSVVDPVAELQDAALNYESASKALMTIANSRLMARSQAPQDEQPKQMQRRRTSNASLELQASDNIMTAAGSLEHAARAWQAAATATQETAARNYFQTTSRYTDQQATKLMRQAAELAESAALEYASANDLRNQANASTKAGRIREKLATRKK